MMELWKSGDYEICTIDIEDLSQDDIDSVDWASANVGDEVLRREDTAGAFAREEDAAAFANQTGDVLNAALVQVKISNDFGGLEHFLDQRELCEFLILQVHSEKSPAPI